MFENVWLHLNSKEKFQKFLYSIIRGKYTTNQSMFLCDILGQQKIFSHFSRAIDFLKDVLYEQSFYLSLFFQIKYLVILLL